MKRWLLLLMTPFVLGACDDDDASRIETWTVAPEKGVAGITTGFGYVPAYIVRKGANPTWEVVTGPIEGFTFEPGYAYELQVERTTFSNPPADASRYGYKLIDERSKQPVECTRETTHLYVSAETGSYDWGIPQTDDAHCMIIRKSENEDWTNVPFNKIIGFTYEKGNAYELSVEKITLDTQPTDDRCQTVQYVLKEIISQAQ